VLYLAYQIIYLFVTGERLQLQTINKDAMIIGFTIVAVRFYLFYEQSKIVSLMQEKEYELTRHKELQNRAELNALQARINPHFLYNALNSIAELIHIDAKRTEKMVLSLSKLFQYNVNREGRILTTLGEEIEMVKVYLEIEKQRLGERLNFKIDVDNSVLNKEIPRFLIQPLVENAIKHGISKLPEKGEIALHCYEKNEKLVIEVYDNGPAFPKGINSGYGLQNTYEKLNIAYNKPYEIKFVNEPKKYLQIVL
jgi:sensor histidine kinase YesM